MFKFKNPVSQPILIFAYTLGVCAHFWVNNPPTNIWLCITMFGLILLATLSQNRILILVCMFSIGFSCMSFRIHYHKSKLLPYTLEGQHVQIVGTIANLPKYNGNSARVDFKVNFLACPKKNWDTPGMVRLTWHAPPKNLQVGDKWNLTVKLKRPRSLANPGGFDLEKYFFQKSICALGVVYSNSTNKLVTNSLWSYPVNSLRQYLFNIITEAMQGREFVGVILALSLGIQEYISEQQWEIFRSTGTAHLMAISGLHIGLLASILFSATKLTGKCWLRIFPSISISTISAWTSIIGAITYALLSGFSIATQRAVIMVVVFLGGILLRRKISRAQSYWLAVAGVLIWDPLAVLAAGFWLSFVAVGCLLLASSTEHRLLRSFKPQLVVFLGMLPVSAIFFGQVSLISPIANFISIPWVSFIVVPIILFSLFTSIIGGSHSLGTYLFTLSAKALGLLWVYLAKCHVIACGIAKSYLGCSSLAIVCAGIGCIWLIFPKGIIPGRVFGLIALLPIFFPKPHVLSEGQVDLTVLDVGQGLSTVIKTKNHTLVYDTGPKGYTGFDAGINVVWPFLRSKAVFEQIDMLVISHPDNDHIGGAVGLLQHVKQADLLISDTTFLQEYNPRRCIAGQHWVWDGVEFTILHPPRGRLKKVKTKNEFSCVLKVTAAQHSILLTGDIGLVSEQVLVNNFADRLSADILVVPHHGSKYSSSLEFIAAVNPRYAIVSVGHMNRYGHPSNDTLARYQSLAIPVLSTAKAGAISVKLGEKLKKIIPVCYRIKNLKFWREK